MKFDCRRKWYATSLSARKATESGLFRDVERCKDCDRWHVKEGKGK